MKISAVQNKGQSLKPQPDFPSLQLPSSAVSWSPAFSTVSNESLSLATGELGMEEASTECPVAEFEWGWPCAPVTNQGSLQSHQPCKENPLKSVHRSKHTISCPHLKSQATAQVSLTSDLPYMFAFGPRGIALQRDIQIHYLETEKHNLMSSPNIKFPRA